MVRIQKRYLLRRDCSFKDPLTLTEERRRLELGGGTCNDKTAVLMTLSSKRKRDYVNKR